MAKHYIFLILLVVVITAGNALNTQCDLSDNAIANDLVGEKAQAPKICFPNGDNKNQRCFYLLVPDCAKENANVQLVVDLHDKGSCPLTQSRTSGWRDYALSECFVVAYPLGITDESVADEPCFTVPGGKQVLSSNGMSLGSAPPCCCTRDGRYISESETNDVNFFRKVMANAIRESANRNIEVNTTTVGLSGYGNGATAALGFTALHSDVVACVTSFAGSLVTQFAQDYNPVPVFTVLNSGYAYVDEELPANDTIPEGKSDYYLPSPARTDGFFSIANHCENATSKTNQVKDSLTGKSGTVTAGKFDGCDAPINFLQPPFAAYKSRNATDAWPVNRVVDSTALAMYFCKNKESIHSAYSSDLLADSSAVSRSWFVATSLAVIFALW